MEGKVTVNRDLTYHITLSQNEAACLYNLLTHCCRGNAISEWEDARQRLVQILLLDKKLELGMNEIVG